MQLSRLPILKIYFLFFTSVVIISLISFKIIEDVSWLDAFYFVVVTLSTVGFGDVIAHYVSTKIITLVLIFNGVVLIVIVSQLVLDRIIKYQLNQQNLLPNKPLNLVNHIIIVGFGAKSRRLANLFKDRSYEVVIVELNKDRAKLAELNDYRVIQGDITKHAILEVLSLDNAGALILLINNDNFTIQTGIIARSISEKIDIYAEIKSANTYDIARIAGINKPIPFINFMTNAVQNHLSHANIELFYGLKELRQYEATLGYALVHLDLEYQEFLGEAHPLGLYAMSLNELIPDINISRQMVSNQKCDHLLLAVDRIELINRFKGENTVQIPHSRIIFAGYSRLVYSVIQRLERTAEDIIILWNTSEEEELALNVDCKKYQWKFEEANELLDKIIRNDDLVVCTFDDITQSLFLAVTLKKLDRNAHLVQVVPYEYELEPFVRVGADAVITPQQVISNAIISIFMKENQLPPSIIFTNGHIFEYLVQHNDGYDSKKIYSLAKSNKKIMLIKPFGAEKFRHPERSDILHDGDRILVLILHE